MYIIAYDVPVKRCSKYSKILEQYGSRIQNSVFIIEDENLFKEVRLILEKNTTPEDKIFIASLKNIISKEEIINQKIILI